MSTDFPFGPWLLTWVGCVSLFLGPIVAIGFFSELVRLHRDGMDRPFFIMVKQCLGVLPVPSWGNPRLNGRRVFVRWDLPWVDSGEIEGRIVSCDPDTKELELRLDRAIPVFNPSGTDVSQSIDLTFIPESADRAPYSFSSVAGTLRSSGGIPVKAKLVVYPKGTH